MQIAAIYRRHVWPSKTLLKNARVKDAAHHPVADAPAFWSRRRDNRFIREIIEQHGPNRTATKLVARGMSRATLRQQNQQPAISLPKLDLRRFGVI